MRVIEFLDKSAVRYEVSEHPPAFTAQQMAAAEHEPGKYVAKPVIVKADGKYIVCVLSACYKIDLGALKSQLGAKSVELAQEKEIGKIFDDCDLEKAIRMSMDDYRKLVEPKVLEFSYHVTS